MTARIYKPAKTAMQSGTAKTKEWTLDFEPEQPRTIEPLMGWTSSGDMRQQVRLQFDSAAEAVTYCERHGIAYAPLVDASEMINLPSTPGQGARQASRELLSHIIHQRLDEIFMLVGREFERAGYGGGRLPAGVVLTGGTAHLPGLVELAREVFAVPVRAGAPELGISGLVDSVQAPRYAVPVGLVLYAARRLMQGAAGHAAGSSGDGSVEKVLGPLKRWLQDFF